MELSQVDLTYLRTAFLWYREFLVDELSYDDITDDLEDRGCFSIGEKERLDIMDRADQHNNVLLDIVGNFCIEKLKCFLDIIQSKDQLLFDTITDALVKIQQDDIPVLPPEECYFEVKAEADSQNKSQHELFITAVHWGTYCITKHLDDPTNIANKLEQHRKMKSFEKRYIARIHTEEGSVEANLSLLNWLEKADREQVDIFVLEILRPVNRRLFELVMDTTEKIKKGLIPIVVPKGFPDIRKLELNDIQTELQKGQSPTELTFWSARAVIHKEIGGFNGLLELLEDLENRLVLTNEEQREISTYLTGNNVDSRSHLCSKLCEVLKKKEDDKINKFLKILSEHDSLPPLAKYLQSLKERCEKVHHRTAPLSSDQLPKLETGNMQSRITFKINQSAPQESDALHHLREPNTIDDCLLGFEPSQRDIEKGSIVVSLCMMKPWDVENVLYIVSSGLFKQRYLSSLHKAGFILSEKDRKSVKIEIIQVEEEDCDSQILPITPKAPPNDPSKTVGNTKILEERAQSEEHKSQHAIYKRMKAKKSKVEMERFGVQAKDRKYDKMARQKAEQEEKLTREQKANLEEKHKNVIREMERLEQSGKLKDSEVEALKKTVYETLIPYWGSKKNESSSVLKAGLAGAGATMAGTAAAAAAGGPLGIPILVGGSVVAGVQLALAGYVVACNQIAQKREEKGRESGI